jgi:hypothetical protein
LEGFGAGEPLEAGPAKSESPLAEVEVFEAAVEEGGDGGRGIPDAVLTKVLSRRIGGGCAARAAYDDATDGSDDAVELSRLALPSAPPPPPPPPLMFLPLLLSPLVPGGGGGSFGLLPAMVGQEEMKLVVIFCGALCTFGRLEGQDNFFQNPNSIS